MKSILLLPFTLFLFFSNADAQTQFEQWHKETIYLHSRGYVKEGKKFSRGLFNTNLKKELKDSPVAMMEFRKSQKNMQAGIIISVLGLAAVMVGLDQEQEGNEKTATTFVLGGLGLSLASIPFSLRAGNQLHRSVWMHNGDLIIPKEK